MPPATPGVRPTPIIDAHAHAWRRWPYQPPVPDPASRGHLDQLRFEMAASGVDEAVIVCAAIGGNDDNLAEVADDLDRHPIDHGRFHLVADVDCPWHSTHHRPGAADRVRRAADRFELAGITHYVGEIDDGWLDSAEGDAFVAAIVERDLILSLSAGVAWHGSVARLARRHPSLPVLMHHLGLARAAVPTDEEVDSVVRLAQVPSILVKLSGLHYVATQPWRFPYGASHGLLGRLVDAFGPDRLCWGSDFPAARAHVTYQQSLEVIRAEHSGLFGHDGMSAVLGGTADEVLRTRRPVAG
ncbi:MAG: amidohydrolase family protein [Terracoccus sp.]